MASTFVQTGNVLTFTAPAGGVTAGLLYVIAGFVVIAQETAAAGADVDGHVCSVHDVPKTSAQAWVVGQDVYLDQTNHVADTDPAKGPRVGAVLAAAANPSSSGRVFFDANARGGARLEAVTKRLPAPTSLATAGAATLTAAQLLSGLIVRDCAGAARTDVLPTAAQLVAAIPNAQVGDMVRCTMINGSDAAEVITLQEGAGGGWDSNFVATKTIGQNQAREVIVRLTNVTASSEAYIVYLG